MPCAGVESNTVLVPVHGEQRRLDDSPALYNMQVRLARSAPAAILHACWGAGPMTARVDGAAVSGMQKRPTATWKPPCGRMSDGRSDSGGV